MPNWQILVVRSGQPETLLEASNAWGMAQRLAARVSFSFIYHAMLDDLMRYGNPRSVYSHNFSGAAVRAHAWRMRNDVCLYVSSVTFTGASPALDDCTGLDALAFEAFDQTSVAVLTCAGKTWLFEQTQGEPILSPLLFACDVDGGISGLAEDGARRAYDGEEIPTTNPLGSRLTCDAGILDAAWLDAWRHGRVHRAQMQTPLGPRPLKLKRRTLPRDLG